MNGLLSDNIELRDRHLDPTPEIKGMLSCNFLLTPGAGKNAKACH